MTILRRAVALTLTAVALLMVGTPAASAHPLGNFTVNQYTGILVTPTGVEIDHVVDLAEIPTAQLGDRVDNLSLLAERTCADIGAHLTVTSRDGALQITGTRHSAVTADGAGGLPVLRVDCGFITALEVTEGELTIANRYRTEGVGWREMVAVGDRMTLTRSDVPTTSLSNRLSSYPDDLLASPPDVRSAQLTVQRGGPTATLPGDPGTGRSDGPGDSLTTRVGELIGKPGPFTAVLALVLALALGALHALAPGHGKTVMAFYLTQGQGSSVRSALGVGASVTIAHTGSVLALGALVSAGSTIVPSRVSHALSLLTAALIVLVGVSLLRRATGHSEPGHGHGHGHAHGHHQGHEQERASDVLTDAVPTEVVTELQRPRRWTTAAMGLVGGLVPSPSALLLLLAAIAAGRAWFGAVLVVAFGVGMALTLATVGLLARDLVLRLERAAIRRGVFGRAVRTTTSYGAAVAVVCIGTVLAVRTLAQMA